MDRLDLAVEMRTSIGDFDHVIKIVGASGGEDEASLAAVRSAG
jgi:hypothetical protein